MQFLLTDTRSCNKFKDYINEIYLKFKDSGKLFYLDIKEGSQIRSIAQNKYYWSVVIEIAKQIIKDTEGKDLESEIVHENLKFNFGIQVFPEDKYWIYVFQNKVLSNEEFEALDYLDRNKCIRVFMMPSTTKMSKKQFMEYIKLIQEWASFLGYEIPDPN